MLYPRIAEYRKVDSLTALVCVCRIDLCVFFSTRDRYDSPWENLLFLSVVVIKDSEGVGRLNALSNPLHVGSCHFRHHLALQMNDHYSSACESHAF
ncbi:hypothetical protein NPIL_586061 [Nephila pilipes]|uniref:Uncharacterized protein n=1 Tax=Nephila pilipes TaxID=299642 RepID=A0A8X6TWW1_NEPPI|nr:hypothetical protein NPIL_586061 [Nephila pilipes]